MLLVGLISCENQEAVFSDFDYTTGYFPYQYPVRTLVLGDYIYDNTNDNNHKFLISAAMGGVYKNTEDRVFNIELAPDLCKNVLFTSTLDTIHLMPSSYYTLSSSSQLTIPAGKVNGNIEVQLTDAFFDDPLAIKLGYVIPLRIVDVTGLDSVLRGSSSKTSPDCRVAGDWTVAPKDYTMFAVKYINPYHGKYLHRGVSNVTSNNLVLETKRYHQKYVVDDEVWSLVTTAKNTVTVSGTLHSSLIVGTLKMDLTFNNDGTCTIKEATGSNYAITGNGKFVKDGDEWGNKKRDAIQISYQFTSGANNFSATDTLVARDRGVVMEVFKPTVF
jgi:Domain of unknown function (DUF1735).